MSFGFSVGDFIAAVELCNKIRRQFIDAPSQFKAISDDVRRLSIVLQDADVSFSIQELSNDQKRALEDIDNGCRNILDELQRILDKNTEFNSEYGSIGGRVKRVWKRLKLDPEDMDKLRGRISTNIGFLNAFNGLITRDNVVKLIQYQKYQDHQTVLDWITPIDYAPQLNDFLKLRQAGTGQWLLDSTKYRQWVETNNQTLFCPGIPGAGKTMLTSVIIEELTIRFQDDKSVGIAYLYCNFWRQYEQKVEDLLASLLKQLTQGLSSLPDTIKSLYDSHQAKRTRLSFDDITRALHSVVTPFSRVFIIIDALDECQVSHNCRQRFLSELFSLQAKCGMNIFATSRFIPEITERFHGNISLEIRASEHDVRRYVDGHMSYLPSFVRRSPDLQEKIRTGIVKAVDGMFLLAQLHLHSLVGKRSPKAIMAALKTLPSGSNAYDYAYKDAMNRIEGQVMDQETLAKQVLLWITCAERPLTIFELRHALAVEVGESELDEDNLPEIEDMVSVCAGLVTIDKESNVIRLAHYTIQEYFERTRSHWFPNAETDITTICISYLSFDAFESGFCQTDDEFEERLRSNRLFEYAAQNWGHHARKAPTFSQPLSQSIVNCITSKDRVDALSQGLFVIKPYAHLKYSHTPPWRMTGLHLTAYFGVETVVKLLLDMGEVEADLKDKDGRTPLSWAAANGHRTVVKLLLDTGKVDADSKDRYCWTPLSQAARNGHETVVKLLLDTGRVNADSRECYGRTPLIVAAGNGHKAVVKLLLDTGKVNANLKDNCGATPLFSAAENRHEAVVKVLLDTDKVIADLENSSGKTPLLIAALLGYEAVVKLLLDTGRVDADSKDDDGCTPLSQAAQNGHETVVKLLLETGKVDADSNDNYGQTPLILAAQNGHVAVVKLLLNTGRVNANSKDENGYSRTPLSWAVENRHEAVVKLLLDSGKVNADLKDNDDQTPLMVAVKYGYEVVAKLLLDMDKVQPDSIDKYGRTLLSYGAGNGHRAVVRLLLDTGKVDADSIDKYGRTPLSYSAGNGHRAVVRLLLDTGKVDADSIDKYGRTPLSYSAENGHEAIVRLLLDIGKADADSKDKHSHPPLFWAAACGHEAIVKLLLDTVKVDADSKDDDGRTPISYSAEYGHRAVVKLLLDTGRVDADSIDKYGRTPLSYSAEDGHEAIVKLLLDIGKVQPDSIDKYGRTPLSYSARYGRKAVVKLLLDTCNVNANSNDKDGWTPLSWAARKGHEAVVKLLLDTGSEVEIENRSGWTPLQLAALNGNEKIGHLLVIHGASEPEDFYGLQRLFLMQ